jgi:hypothetical protein
MNSRLIRMWTTYNPDVEKGPEQTQEARPVDDVVGVGAFDYRMNLV